MNRKLDVLRHILIAARDSAVPLAGLDGMDNSDFAMHAQWLSEAGLVGAALRTNDERPASAAVIFRLTWNGLEVADAITDEALWRRACSHIAKPGESWTFDVLLDAVKREIKFTLLPGYN